MMNPSTLQIVISNRLSLIITLFMTGECFYRIFITNVIIFIVVALSDERVDNHAMQWNIKYKA